MWHEARRQEKQLRARIIDGSKRAERRRKFYDSIVSVFAILFLNLKFREEIQINLCNYTVQNVSYIQRDLLLEQPKMLIYCTLHPFPLNTLLISDDLGKGIRMF